MNPKLKQRILTAILFGLFFIPLLIYDRGTAQLLFIVILILMQYEYGKIVFAGESGAFPKILSGLFISIFPTIYFLWKGEPVPGSDYFLIICLIFILVNGIMLLHKKKVLIQFKPYYFQGLLYLGLPIYLLSLQLHEPGQFNHVLMGIFILIWMSDSMAYFAGSKWGKRKLFEQVSPNKTWEGTLAALPAALLTGWILSYFFDQLSLLDWLVMSIVVWIAGTLGDLVESAFKRYFKIKDTGDFLPGHGGFLDRFDSFIYVLPLLLAYMKYIQ